MKKTKRFLPLASLAVCAILGGSTMAVNASALTSTNSTNDWMPHNYVLDGYDIPTVMTYDSTSGAVTFTGSLNAGVATTGFAYNKPIDLNNFSIDIDFNIPDISALQWISFSFLDKNILSDQENSIPVCQPFNAVSGYGFKNTLQSGGIFQFYMKDEDTGTDLIVNNAMRATFNAKCMDPITGEANDDGWFDLCKDIEKDATTGEVISKTMNNNFMNYVQLTDGINYAQETASMKFTVEAEGEGLKVGLNDGAWKGAYAVTDAYEQEPGKLNANHTLAGLKKFFENKDCYFSCTIMYSDDEQRSVSMTVNELNGQPACDGTAPTYSADKTVTNGNVQATVKTSAVGLHGVYAQSIDNLEVLRYDDSDDDYQAVISRKNKLKMELVDYFKVYPKVGDIRLRTKDFFEVEYTPETQYDNYKIYYINDDGEAQSLPSGYSSIADGKITIKVDNEVVSKVIIYGSNNAATGGTTNDTNTDSGSEDTGGCGSSISCVYLGVVALAGVALSKVFFKKNKNRG